MNIPSGSGSVPSAGFGYSRPNSSLNLQNFGITGTPAANNNLGLGQLQVDTTVRPNAYIGLSSFVSVAAHYVVIDDLKEPSSASDTKELSISMLCFARNIERIPSTRSAQVPQYGTLLGPNTCEIKELTQLNEYLARNSHLYSSAAEIAAEWKLLGVIKNETAPTNTISSYGNAPRSRIVNFIVSHRVAVFNYWSSSRIVQTQKLYLIIRYNSITSRYEIKPWTSINRDSPRYMDMLSVQKPSDAADDRTIGVALYVGKSSDQTHSLQTVENRYMTSLDVSNSMVKRGIMETIEIYVGI
jgi:hypothetical protein